MLEPRLMAAVVASALLAACTQTQTPPPNTAAATMDPDSATVFTLALSPGSLTDCVLGDPGMTRPMTLSVVNNQAMLMTSGGIHYALNRVQPNVYAGGYYIKIQADLSVRPKRLSVSNNDRACTWTGTAG